MDDEAAMMWDVAALTAGDVADWNAAVAANDFRAMAQVMAKACDHEAEALAALPYVTAFRPMAQAFIAALTALQRKN